MKIYIVGIGMDGDKTLTAQAKAAIQSADALIGAKRMLEPFADLHKPTLATWKTEEICRYIDEGSCNTAAVLMSGDCGFFSGAEKLMKKLGDKDTEILCGISSPVYFCAKIQKPWQDMAFVSLHGQRGNVIRSICRNRYCFFLLGGDVTPAAICQKILDFELPDIQVYIGENLSYKNEKIYRGTPRDFQELSCGGLCVMVTENPGFERGITSGIPDGAFLREQVPMTKSEIRSTVISKLGIGADSICWDLGCGTGSVTVEMALQCYRGTVYAVDKKEQAVALTEKNCRRFGCDNVVALCADAEACVAALPAPDQVFIGGSGGELRGLMAAALEKNPRAAIVVTAVSLETLKLAQEAFQSFHIPAEIVQVVVTRTKTVGSYTMFSAENPVFILKGVGT